MSSLLKSNRFRRAGVRCFLAACMTAVPAIVVGISEAASNITDGVHLWFPREMPETREYKRFLSRFGSDELIVISWPECTLQDARADRLAAELRRNPRRFSLVLTGSGMMATLTGPPARLSAAEAESRLRGILVGPSGQHSGLLIRLTEAAARDRARTIQSLRTAAEACGIPATQLRMGGPAVDSFAMEQAARFTMNVLMGLLAVVGFALAWLALRSLYLTVVVVTAAGFCGAASIAGMALTGQRLNLILLMIPAVTYMLTISAAIHFMNYYWQVRSASAAQHAGWNAARRAWKPCVLSFVTTAAGLVSLCSSSVEPLRRFGLFAALSILAAIPVLLIAVPAVLTAVPPGLNLRGSRAADHCRLRWTRRCPSRLRRLIEQRHGVVALSGVSAMVLCGLALPSLQTTLRIRDLFCARSPVIRDYQWLEERLGPLAPVEAIVEFPCVRPRSMLDRSERLSGIQETLIGSRGVGGGISVATFVPDRAPAFGLKAVARRRVVLQRLIESRDRFADEGLLSADQMSECWRISLRIPAVGHEDTGQVIAAIQRRLSVAATDTDEEPVLFTCTGLAPLTLAAQQALLHDLSASVFIAAGLVALSLMVFLRSLSAGLLAMIPNLCPLVVLLGIAGWIGQPVGIGTVLAAGLSLGVIVDNELHFLHWFRSGVSSGLSRRGAVRQACRCCAGPMVRTALICGPGLLTFYAGDFIPVAHFGLLMCVLLISGAVINLTLLPALLIGPAGVLFEPQPSRVSSVAVAASRIRETCSSPCRSFPE